MCVPRISACAHACASDSQPQASQDKCRDWQKAWGQTQHLAATLHACVAIICPLMLLQDETSKRSVKADLLLAIGLCMGPQAKIQSFCIAGPAFAVYSTLKVVTL